MDRLEILPWGRTREQQDAIDAKKREGRKGPRGCFWQLAAIAAFIFYAYGEMIWRKESVNESAIRQGHGNDRPKARTDCQAVGT